MEQDGFTIRRVDRCRNITPTSADDDTKGFVAGSLWILDDGTSYACSDNSTGSAVWVEQATQSSTGGNGTADAGKLVEFGAEGQITVSESVTFGDTDYSGTLQFPAQYFTQLGQDIDGEADGDLSGLSVSMNAAGDRVAIGAPYNEGNSDDKGHVRVYGAPTNLSYQWTLPQTNGTVVVSDNPLISIATVAQTANTVASRDDDGRLRATQLRLHGPTYYSQLNFSPSPTGNRSFTFPNESGTIALISVAQTFTGLQQFSTRPRSSAALTPANTTELITLADGDSRYGAFYNGVSIPQVSSTNTTPIKVASVILPIGVYQIDSFVASVHGTVGLCTIGLKTSQTAKITAFENYGNDNTAHVSSAIASDNFAGASQRSATSGGTFSRRVTGIIEIITAGTELSIEYSQATTDAIASLTRKRAYITATKLS
jgi:hypothetical protein